MLRIGKSYQKTRDRALRLVQAGAAAQRALFADDERRRVARDYASRF